MFMVYHCFQLLYDFGGGGSSIGLISLKPEQLDEEKKRKFERIGVETRSSM